MNIFRTFLHWFTGRSRPSTFCMDLALLSRCARIVRGEEPGRVPRSGGPFPAWGQADLEGRNLVWSGPFSFDLDLQYKLLVEALPGVYVSDPRPPTGLVSYGPDPLLTFVIAESATWATLWPQRAERIE